ncbi:hypothetical protein P7H22_08055 [Paenibacillus larvae]|nr:hypothetical protein [Paenibacillus larvae]MDT2240289.1 hypothetical protein [Paenibacillus larvae]
MGIRGPQEQSRYILSARALIARKEEVARSIRELSLKLEELDESIRQDTKRMQELNSIIHLVREAEAFMTREHERASRVIKQEEETARREELVEHIRELRKVQKELIEKRLKLERDQGELKGEAEFYVRLGQQKEKYQDLNAKQRYLRSLSGQHEELEHQHENCEDQLDNLEKELRKQQRELQDIQDQQEREERKLRQIHNQLQSRIDSLDTVKGGYVSSIQELEEFKRLAPHIYNEVARGIVCSQSTQANFLPYLKSVRTLKQAK